MNAKQTEKQEAIDDLRKLLHPGDTVYTILRNVSRSGMSRTVDAYIMQDNEPRRLSWAISKAIGFTYDKVHEGIKVGGCGMDVGFEVVYHLGYALWPDGFDCTGDGNRSNISGEWCLPACPSNDHSNDYMGTVPEVLRYSPDRHHSEGGYALRQRWM